VSEFLLIAMLPLAAMVGPLLRAMWKEKSGEAFHLIGVGLLCIFVTAQIPVWQYGLHLTDAWYHARKQHRHWCCSFRISAGESQCAGQGLEAMELPGSGGDAAARDGAAEVSALESPELKWFTKQDKVLGEEKAEIARHDSWRTARWRF